jgi:hypothetical protein
MHAYTHEVLYLYGILGDKDTVPHSLILSISWKLSFLCYSHITSVTDPMYPLGRIMADENKKLLVICTSLEYILACPC